ncbi:MAG: DUF4910 domain-containing protein [Thermoproteota archaeon]
MLRAILDDMVKHASPLKAFKTATELSELHRIQGTEDIVEAAKLVAEALDSMGVEHKVITYGELELWREWGFWEPRGWRLDRASLEVLEGGRWVEVASTDRTKLVAAAHSPRGVVEGNASYLRPRLEGDEVVVTYGFRREDYLAAQGKGFTAVVATHQGPGVRYYGIFPPPFSEPPTAPVVSVDLASAMRVSGRKVRITVESEYAAPTTPVVYATVGYTNGTGILIVSHICHPSPGSHDNASGVAVSLEAARILAMHSKKLEEAGFSVHFLFVPEYTGTAAALSKKVVDPALLLAAASLDMVGANVNATGGCLRIYESPAFATPLSAILDAALSGLEGYCGISGYSVGSDHDVSLALGVPSILVNEWPDRFYHTSMDMPSNLDASRMALVAAALSASALSLASKSRRLVDIYKSYASSRMSFLLARSRLGLVDGSEEDVSELARSTVDAGAKRLSTLLRGDPVAIPAGALKVRPTVSRPYLRLFYGEEASRLLSLSDEEYRRLQEALIAASATGSLSFGELYVKALFGARLAEIYREASELLKPR